MHLGVGTDFLKFLGAIHSGAVYYDPGIKMEHAGTAKPRIKKRSQFRVNFKKIGSLYNSWERVTLNEVDHQ